MFEVQFFCDESLSMIRHYESDEMAQRAIEAWEESSPYNSATLNIGGTGNDD